MSGSVEALVPRSGMRLKTHGGPSGRGWCLQCGTAWREWVHGDIAVRKVFKDLQIHARKTGHEIVTQKTTLKHYLPKTLHDQTDI